MQSVRRNARRAASLSTGQSIRGLVTSREVTSRGLGRRSSQTFTSVPPHLIEEATASDTPIPHWCPTCRDHHFGQGAARDRGTFTLWNPDDVKNCLCADALDGCRR